MKLKLKIFLLLSIMILAFCFVSLFYQTKFKLLDSHLQMHMCTFVCVEVCVCLFLCTYVCMCVYVCLCVFACTLPGYSENRLEFFQLRNPSAGVPRDRHCVCQLPDSSCDAAVAVAADEAAAGSSGSHGGGEGRARGLEKARIEQLKSSGALLESVAGRRSVADNVVAVVVDDVVVVVDGTVAVVVAVVAEGDDGSDSVADVVEPVAVDIVAPVDDPHGKEPTPPDPFPGVPLGDPRIQAPGKPYHQPHWSPWLHLSRVLALLCPSA